MNSLRSFDVVAPTPIAN